MKICLITTGQPSTNPRLVKEADAFSEAGHEVNVVAAHWSEWASNLDGPLLASRQWRMSLVDWRRHRAPFLFHLARLQPAWTRPAQWIKKGARFFETVDELTLVYQGASKLVQDYRKLIR